MSDQPSFIKDVVQVMDTILWQDISPDKTPELREITTALNAFHNRLAEHDHIERGQLISEALDVLTGDDYDDIVDVDAMLAVGFEVFFPLDRAYLDTFSTDYDLVCIAEEHASVRRTWIETGPVTDHVSFRDSRHAASVQQLTCPVATAAYFVEGTVVDDPATGSVSVLAADSADDQLAAIANEIEELVEQTGWSYDDIAIGTKQSGSSVTDTIESFERNGIPTESTAVTGFGDDPAIRELFAVVRHLAADENDEVPDYEPALDMDRLARADEIGRLKDAVRWWPNRFQAERTNRRAGTTA